MDKKKVIKWLVGILANLAALIAVFLTANPQISKANAEKKDSLQQIEKSHFVPSYSKSENPGFLSKVVDEVSSQIAGEQELRYARERVITKSDTIINRRKTSIHLLHQQYFDDRFAIFRKLEDSLGISVNSTHATDWDKLNSTKTSGGLAGNYHLKNNMHVFGWHPYWMGTAYKTYNFSLLSTVAFYGAEVDPATGDFLTTHGWETSGLFDAVAGTDCRVELTVINIGVNCNEDFLKDSVIQQNLIYNITDRLSVHGNGVCLDFEDVPKTMRENLVKFVTKLRADLDTLNEKMLYDDPFIKPFSISVVLPCYDWTNAFDVKALAPLVERFVVTGYDYYGSFSSSTGPVAPLRSDIKWGVPNIEQSVDSYLHKGIPASKLLLGLPYYGAKWQSLNTKVPSPVVQFLDFPVYRRIRNELGLKAIRYDTTSVSTYYVVPGTLPVQYWFDDSETLAEKYRWLQHKHLGGVGIWALGYDNGYPELWQTLLDNFGRDRLGEDTTYQSKFPIAYRDTTLMPPDKEWGIVAANGHYLIFDHPYALLCGIFAVFALILLLQVLLDDQPFNELFSRRLVLFIVSSLAGTAVIILLGLSLWCKVPHREIYLLLAGILGGYLLFRLTQRIVGKKERLP
ncbi:MAG: glycoside hydrolase family 18 protein [Bacteroidia bacterium]